MFRELSERKDEKAGVLPFNLQMFADEGEQSDADSDSEDADNSQDGEENGEADGEEGNVEEKKEKTFTQKQVNKMMAREKRQGKRAALKDYGLEGYTKEQIAEVVKKLESEKSDEQKNVEEKLQEQEKAKKLRDRTLKAEFKAEALGANCKDKYLEDVITLAVAKASDDEDVDAAEIIAEIKEKHKVFFSSNEPDNEGQKGGKNKQSKSRGTGGAPREGSKGGNEKGLGARLAAKRKGVKSGESKFFR